MTVSLALLVERLHWPVPRVRWEAARQIAALIRVGDDAARSALLDWTRRQWLEADALVTPSLVEAFELSEILTFEELHDAIRAPSVLSDAVLASLYPDQAARLFGFRLGYTREPPPSEASSNRFDEGIGTLVPRIFYTYFEWTERDFGLPFLDRFRTEWAFLDRTFHEAYTEHPSFFFAGDRGVTGSLDVRQRQVFVSAFLRVIAYARAEWAMPHGLALECAEIAIPFNAGLARFVTSTRPDWSTGLIERLEDLGAEALARTIWQEASVATPPGYEPLALDVMDHNEKNAIRLEIHRVLEERGGDAPQLTELGDLTWLNPRPHRRSLEGRLPAQHTWSYGEGLRPLAVEVHPSALGRAHIDLLLGHLQLATPVIGSGVCTIECHRERVTMTDEAGILAELHVWHADWEPVHPKDMPSLGHVTICRSSALRDLRSTGVRTPRLARLHIDRREHSYEKFEANKRSFRF